MATQDGEIKVVQGITPVFIVDGFNFCRADCEHYFLSEWLFGGMLLECGREGLLLS